MLGLALHLSTALKMGSADINIMRRQYKFAIGIVLITLSVGSLVFTAVDQTKMYMLTVAEYIASGDEYSDSTVRIAGRVREDSMEWDSTTRELRFTLDDISAEGTVDVHYAGLLPDMFSEGRDVIVEGPPTQGPVFEAGQVLTACPSKYEPE